MPREPRSAKLNMVLTPVPPSSERRCGKLERGLAHGRREVGVGRWGKEALPAPFLAYVPWSEVRASASMLVTLFVSEGNTRVGGAAALSGIARRSRAGGSRTSMQSCTVDLGPTVFPLTADVRGV